MTEKDKSSPYMVRLLEQMGWDQGTRIPLSNVDNHELETRLIERQNEIQHLKEALLLQNQKRDDLDKYKCNVHTEYQENTRLLFAHKQQYEQEVKLRQLSQNEIQMIERDVVDCQKQSKNITSRIDRLQLNIAKLLKKADSLKSEVCGERGALQEWRAALERSAGDITAIEQFTKQDLSKAKALETKRQQLKQEHDHMHERLNQLVSNLSAEERACERISIQVMEGMEQRKQMMTMWTSAVENLRQRDTDIRHIREDYAVLDAESNNIAEKCREQQSFYDQQRGNNAEARRENMTITQQLNHARRLYQQLIELNVNLDSKEQILQRELSSSRNLLEELHLENRQIMEEQHRKDIAMKSINEKIRELKEKLTDSTDKSQSSEKRARELEDMLNEEQRLASQMTVNQQRAMHCSFVEQQKLLALKNEEKLFHMQLKASKAIMSKLHNKQRDMERNLQSQKESLYAIRYQVESVGARVAHMEGAQAERECSADLLHRENRLKEVCARHAARVALLERHSARLLDDMRRLSRDLETKTALHTKLQSTLRSWMVSVEGAGKEVRAAREECARARVEQAVLRLRAGLAARAQLNLHRDHFTLDNQRLNIDAAMKERLVEIGARREVLSRVRRELAAACGALRGDARERENRIEQLKKRYDIFIDSLGKDDSGQQLSVTFFKIKFAGERAELRERGAALDAEVSRRERDVAALEAALRLVHAAHDRFMHHVTPLHDDTPEIVELRKLCEQYHGASDELKGVREQLSGAQLRAAAAAARRDAASAAATHLAARQAESESEVESSRERVSRQRSRLAHARDLVRTNLRRAKKLIDDTDDWKYFNLSMCVTWYGESAWGAALALSEAAPPARLAALVAGADLTRLLHTHQRRLRTLLCKLLDTTDSERKGSTFEVEESVFSESSESMRSGVSVASGFTKRLSGFRKKLALKVQEQALIDEIPEQARRSTVSLRVVTLGMEESSPAMASASAMSRAIQHSRKSSR